MNVRKRMIIIKGEIKTSEVRACRYNAVKKTIDVEFNKLLRFKTNGSGEKRRIVKKHFKKV